MNRLTVAVDLRREYAMEQEWDDEGMQICLQIMDTWKALHRGLVFWMISEGIRIGMR